MIAKDCGRSALGWLLGFALAGIFSTEPAQAQQRSRSLFGGSRPAAPKAQEAEPAEATQPARLDPTNTPTAKLTAIPVNPTDPIAIVNGQVISRQQLADECVARKGKEILDTLINRTLIEQSLKARKQEVT